MARTGGFRIADAFVELHLDRDAYDRAVADLPSSSGPAADRAGREIGKRVSESAARGVDGGKIGDKLSQGMRMSIIRNSPLIVAGISAALAAGAPVALAGATALFAGIGIVAAAQSVAVRSAWTDTWHEIRDGTVAASGPIQAVLVGMADKVGASFQRMRPALQNIFTAAAPQIAVFTDGILSLAENALPGLTRAVQAGMPVTQGLADLLGKVGTGLTGFFDAMSAHAPAAGKAFSAIGDILAALLPILGELLGQGAELAAFVLPPLASALGVVADVVSALAPLLPALAAGFGTLKIAQAVSGWLGGLGTTLKDLPGKLSGAATGITAFGVAAGLVSAAFVAAKQRTDEWARAILEGGQAAATARAEMAQFRTVADEHTTGFRGLVESILGTNTAYRIMGGAVGEVGTTFQDLLASMDPVSAAKARLQQATNNLSRVLADEESTTGEVALAHAAFEQATRESDAAQADLEMAISGVTSAMLEQADQALAGIDSGFAYRQSVDQLEDAQANLTETIKNRTNADEDLRTSEEDVQRAQLAVEQQTFRTAAAYAQSQADLSGLSRESDDYKRLVQTELLRELTRLRDAAGPQMRAAIDAQIGALRAAGVSLSSTSVQTRTLSEQLNFLGNQRPSPIATLLDRASPTAAAIRNTINTIPLFRTSNVFINTYRTEILRTVRQTLSGVPLFGGATGGMIGNLLRGFADGGSPGGKIRGPGSMLDDLVLALTESGEPIRLSNNEWVVKGLSSQKYGDRRMQSVNDGTALVLAPEEVARMRGLAAGGGLPERGAGAPVPAPAAVTNHNTVIIQGTFDLASSRDLRRVAQVIEQELIKLQREHG